MRGRNPSSLHKAVRPGPHQHGHASQSDYDMAFISNVRQDPYFAFCDILSRCPQRRPVNTAPDIQ